MSRPDHRYVLGIALVAALCFSGACKESIELENLPGHVTSVGPLFFDGTVLTVQFTTRDEEGDRIDVTALGWAAFNGHTAVVSLLIEAGADLDARAHYGTTALMSATLQGRVAVVRILVEAGADLTIKDRSGSTALMWATKKGLSEVIEVLRDSSTGGPINE